MRIISLIIFLLSIAAVHSIVDRTYFNYLGIKISANSDQLHKAYQLKKAKIQAIDSPEEKERKSRLLKQAFDTLSNDKERQKYERYGKDIFRTIKEMTCIDKRNPESPKDERKSPTFKLTIPLSIEDIYNGTIIKAQYQMQQACPLCQGTGAKSPKDLKPCKQCSVNGFTLRDEQNFYGQKFQAETICPVCRGAGKTVTKNCDRCNGHKLITTLKTIQIPIPKGLAGGNTFILKNYGPQPQVGAPSDFEITVIEVPTKKWSREVNNLVYNMQISLEESLFGFIRTFLHLDGAEITVDRTGQMTTKDTKQLVKQKGLLNNQGYLGNLIVKFRVKIPKFSDEQLDMWEHFFNQHPM